VIDIMIAILVTGTLLPIVVARMAGRDYEGPAGKKPRTEDASIMTENRGVMDFFSRIFAEPTSAPVADRPATTAPLPDPGPAPHATPAIIDDPRVPAKSRAKAKAILATIATLSPRLAGRGQADQCVMEVHRIRDAHLAELLQRYVDIPEEHRAEIFRRTQKSASYHLGESLDVISARLSEISRDLAQGVLDQFTDSTRFVDTQYGRSDSPFG
jgi:hypothetical protein